VLLFVILTLSLPPTTADSVDPLRPLAASATIAGGTTLVSWVPGQAHADSFNVYGINRSGTLVLLRNVPSPQDSTTLISDGAYRAYAVTGVAGPTESSAAMLYIHLCSVDFEVFPPNVWAGCDPIIEGPLP
jgi:hypothetical protein